MLTTTACAERKNPDTDNDANKPIEAFASIQNNANTKAIATNAQKLTGIVFLRLDNPNTNMTTFDFSEATKIAGVREAGSTGKIIFSPRQYYDKVEDKTSYFVGYHPEGTFDNTAKTVTWPTNATTDVLLSTPWNAGKFVAPSKTPLEMEHYTARIEVIAQAKLGEALPNVRNTWGKIDEIKILDCKMSMTYTYATNKITIGETIGEVSMMKGKLYDPTKPFVPADIEANGTTEIFAGAMVVPRTSTVIKLRLRSKTGAIVTNVAVPIGGELQAGKVHRVVLNFSDEGNIVVQPIVILPWELRTSDDNVISPI